MLTFPKTTTRFVVRLATLALLLTLMAGSMYAGTFDGPAELPRVYVQSALSSTPSPGKVWNVSSGGSVQQAINSAACGDTVSLQAGATFTLPITLVAKNCDAQHWITIRTSSTALPAPGTRLTPCYAGVASLPSRPALNCKSTTKVVASIVSSYKGGNAVVIVNPGAKYYRLTGLELTRTAGGNLNSIVLFQSNADHIIFDRLWIHGTTHDDTAHGIYLAGSTNVAVIDSYINDMHCTAITGGCSDSQTIDGGSSSYTMGPYQIVDNYLEASGENVMFGGGPATMTAADIEIRRNHFYKPLIWKQGTTGYITGNSANPMVVKNFLELKNAQRVLVDGNIMEYTWGGFSQMGYGIVLSPKNQTINGVNVCSICQVTDVTIRYTTISHVASGFQIANAPSSGGGAPLAGERYSIHDVTVDDINGVTYKGPGSVALVAVLGTNMPVLQNVQFNHVTAFAPTTMLYIGNPKSSKQMINFLFQNSLVTTGRYPVWSSGGTTNCAISDVPITVFSTCFNPYSFVRNGLIASPSAFPPSLWPSGNAFPSSTTTAQFVNYNNGNGGNYQLLSTSPYKNGGTDGKDLGADFTALRAAITGVY